MCKCMRNQQKLILSLKNYRRKQKIWKEETATKTLKKKKFDFILDKACENSMAAIVSSKNWTVRPCSHSRSYIALLHAGKNGFWDPCLRRKIRGEQRTSGHTFPVADNKLDRKLCALLQTGEEDGSQILHIPCWRPRKLTDHGHETLPTER